jgi:hypothetical protein
MGLLRAASRFVERGVSLEEAARNTTGGFASAMTGANPPSQRSTAELLKLYRSSPWVRLALDIISQRTASARWVILAPRVGASRSMAQSIKAKWLNTPHEMRDDLTKEMLEDQDLREIDEHPLLTIVHQGVPGVIDGMAMARMLQQQKDLVGEWITVVMRNEHGVPVSLLPLSPAWVKTPQESGHGQFEVRLSSQTILLPPQDVAWCKNPDPSAPYSRGSGIFQALSDEIEVDEQTAKYMGALLRNRARPDLLIMGPGLNKRQADALGIGWRQQLQGVFKQGMPFFMGTPARVGSQDADARSILVKDLSRSAHDMQSTDVRKHERDIILQVANVPPDVVGATESSNRATSFVANKNLRTNKIIPELEHARRFLQARFLEPIGDAPAEFFGEDRLLLMYKLPPLVDEQLRLDTMKAAPWAPRINEWRNVQGLPTEPEMEGLRLVPLNTQVVEQDDIVEATELTSPASALPDANSRQIAEGSEAED